MAKQHVAEQETLGEAMNKTEFFFEKNGRMLSYVFLGLLVLAALVFGYRALIVSPRAEKAAEMIAEAQYRFEDQNADYALALEGDANGAGFLEVIEKYGSTPSGNLAKHYAGICYLKAGDLENAAKFLARYSPVKGIPGALINAQNYGLQGDIAVEQKDYAKAEILRQSRSGCRQQPHRSDVPPQSRPGRAGPGQRRESGRILRADTDFVPGVDGRTRRGETSRQHKITGDYGDQEA